MTKRLISVLSGLGLLALSASGASQAETLKMKPGNWESTITMDSPMTGKQTQTQAQCIEEEEFDPNQFLQGQEGCSMVSQDVTDNTLKFEMACDNQGMQATMNGEMVIDGDTSSGTITMKMNVAGQEMNMNMDIQSKRLGDC